MEIIYSSLYRTNNAAGDVVVMSLGQYNRMAKIMPEFADYGGTGLLHPPITMSSAGAADDADGYGKQFDLNVGQWPGRPTRWGTAQELLDCNAACHRSGLWVLEDLVTHQYDGSQKDGTYPEIGSDGKLGSGPFLKTPGMLVRFDAEGNWVLGYAHPDPVFDAQGNYAFGDMCAYVNGNPKGYLLNGVIRAAKWRKKRFALDGCRLDDTKGENLVVAKSILSALQYAIAFGECYSNNAESSRWSAEEGGKVTLDFDAHFLVRGITLGASLRSLPGLQTGPLSPSRAMRFPDTADTNSPANQGTTGIQFNKLWAYFLFLTLPAFGCLVHAADYELYGLDADIRQMMWVSRVLCFGNLKWLYVDDTLAIYQLDGDGGEYGWSGGVICVLNTDPINWRGAWVPTIWGPNRKLNCYLGHAGQPETNQDGWVYASAPPNVNGAAKSTSAIAPSGIEYQVPIVPKPHNPEGSFTDFRDF